MSDRAAESETHLVLDIDFTSPHTALSCAECHSTLLFASCGSHSVFSVFIQHRVRNRARCHAPFPVRALVLRPVPVMQPSPTSRDG